jgi:inner membrane protein
VSPVTHLLSGWLLANAAGLDRRGRMVVTLASVAPDVDGFGFLPELLKRNSANPITWYSQYHHTFGHCLLFAGLAAVIGAIAAPAVRMRVLLFAFLSVHLHLFMDLVGSGAPDGYRWPIPYLFPSRRIVWSWSGQWAVNAWPNVVLTLAMLVATFWLATYAGRTPVEVFSSATDTKVAAAFKRWVRRAA